MPGAPFSPAIARRPARRAWPMPTVGSRRCCPNGDKAGPNHVAVHAIAGLNRDSMSEPASPVPANPANDGFASLGPDVIAPGEGELIVNLEGFQGPLDL